MLTNYLPRAGIYILPRKNRGEENKRKQGKRNDEKGRKREEYRREKGRKEVNSSRNREEFQNISRGERFSGWP